MSSQEISKQKLRSKTKQKQMKSKESNITKMNSIMSKMLYCQREVVDCHISSFLMIMDEDLLGEKLLNELKEKYPRDYRSVYFMHYTGAINNYYITVKENNSFILKFESNDHKFLEYLCGCLTFQYIKNIN